MQFGEFMGLAVVVGGMIAIVDILMKAYRAKLQLGEREIELRILQAGQGQSPAPVEARIEQRLRVLERIATDKGPNLAAEIEQLRDERARQTEVQ